MVINKHNVPAKIWKKLSEHQQKVYNKTMDNALVMQAEFTHPDTEMMGEEEWFTICHNMTLVTLWNTKKIRDLVVVE